MGCYACTAKPPPLALKDLEKVEQYIFEQEDAAPWDQVDFSKFDQTMRKQGKGNASQEQFTKILRQCAIPMQVSMEPSNPHQTFFQALAQEDLYNTEKFYLSVLLTHRQPSDQKAGYLYDYCIGSQCTKDKLHQTIQKLVEVAAKVLPCIAKSVSSSGFNIENYKAGLLDGTDYFIDRMTSQILKTYVELSRQDFIDAINHSEETQCLVWGVGIRTMIKTYKINQVREEVADFFHGAVQQLEQARADGSEVPSALLCCLRRMETETRGNES